MNDFVKKALRGGQEAHAEYKKVKAKKDKIKGLIKDITELHTIASHLLEYKVNTSSVLLKLAYKGVERLAKKSAGNAPILSFFFRYHQPHMDLLGAVLRAKNEANFAIKWQTACATKSKQIEETVDSIVSKYGFAGPMLDGNRKLTSNVPQNFHDFVHFVTYEPHHDTSEAEISRNTRSEAWLDYEQERLGLEILENARDIAGAFYAVSAEVNKYIKSTNQANIYFRDLQKAKTAPEGAIGVLAEKTMYEAAYVAGGTVPGNQAFEEVLFFTSGAFTKAPSWKRVGSSYRELRALSENWQRWAKLVASGNHLIKY